jgi:hypothetical protein
MPVEGATGYELQVDNSSAFTLPLTYTRTTTTETAAGTSTLPTADLFWRIRALAGSTIGPWSPTRSFRVN